MRVLTTVFDVRQSTLNLAKMPVECRVRKVGCAAWSAKTGLAWQICPACRARFLLFGLENMLQRERLGGDKDFAQKEGIAADQR